MASVRENYCYWEETYDWSQGGEEWSTGWGGSDRLWISSIRPRLKRWLPADSLLEIAPGFGRLSGYLMQDCHHYIGVDISPSCVAHCQGKFPQANFFTNDGKTLPMLEADSIHLAFSFFSLIHADLDIMQSYLCELARVLKPQGAAFLHHSNLACHQAYFRRLDSLPRWLAKLLGKASLVDLPQWRDPRVDAKLVAKLAEQAGLAVVTQETINFGSRRTIDCFTTLVRADGPWHASGLFWEHPGFMQEAMRSRLRSTPTPAILSPQHYEGPWLKS